MVEFEAAVRLLNSGRIEQSQEHADEKDETKAEQCRCPVPPGNTHAIHSAVMN
jgi:hypothetical protein